MKRTEKLNISISKDLKAGFKELFKGERLSDAFEMMVIKYAKSELSVKHAQCIGMCDALKRYIEQPDYSKAVELSLKEEIDKYSDESDRLYSIVEMMRGDVL